MEKHRLYVVICPCTFYVTENLENLERQIVFV